MMLSLRHGCDARARACVVLVTAGLVWATSGCAPGEDPDTSADGVVPELTDVRGRPVALPEGAPRIAVDDGRVLLALSALVDDPTASVVGWPHDVARIGEGTYEALVERFPRLPELGRVTSSAQPFSLEQTLAVEPTIAVFSLGRGPSDDQLVQLEQAGVVPIFVDFYMDPLQNVDRSIEILGRVAGATERAAALVTLRTERRERIRRVLETADRISPPVFLEAHAGMSPECCNSPGKGNVGVYIDYVGGHNIGADVLPGPIGRVSLEYVLERDPAVYIATGGPHLERAGGLVMGSGYGAEEAQAALRRAVARPGFEHLGALASGRVHGLSHHLLNSPLDIVAVELLAQWIHPDVFGGLDPAETLALINRNFLAVPVEGAHWVSLEP